MEDKLEKTEVNNADKLVRKRKRNSTRPPLSRAVYNVIIEYILETRTTPDESRLPWKRWLDILKETSFRKFANGMSCKKRFLNWVEFLDVEERDGENVLCLKHSQTPCRKIVPCLEDFSKVIRNAHTGTGEFANETINQVKKTQKFEHNPFEKCMRMIKEKYAFGSGQFGIPKIHVYKELIGCPECSQGEKPNLPSKDVISQLEMIDPDFGNEMNFIPYEKTPSCMVMKGPTDNSVWYDQDGLASESLLYSKLIGVVKEVGAELGQCAQGDEISRERLFTKLCCAEKLVKDLKNDIEPTFCLKTPSDAFLADYDELQNVYKNNCSLDVFLHDTCILTNVYRRYRNDKFVEKLNEGFQHYAKDLNGEMTVSLDGNCLVLDGRKRSGTHNVELDNKRSKNDEEVNGVENS